MVYDELLVRNEPEIEEGPTPAEIIRDSRDPIQNGIPPKSDPSTHGPQFQQPEVSTYRGDGNPNHEVAISTEALEHFAKQLDKIVTDGGGILMDARAKLDGVNIRPGAFAKAEVLRQKIVGVSATDAGLRGETMTLLLAIQEALFAVKSGVRKTVEGYEAAEEFNGMTADQLKESMDGAWAKIQKVSGLGGAAGTTTGG